MFATIEKLDNHYRSQWNGTIRDRDNGNITHSDMELYLDDIHLEWETDLGLMFRAITQSLIPDLSLHNYRDIIT